jgi:hypothetical protein
MRIRVMGVRPLQGKEPAGTCQPLHEATPRDFVSHYPILQGQRVLLLCV